MKKKRTLLSFILTIVVALSLVCIMPSSAFAAPDAADTPAPPAPINEIFPDAAIAGKVAEELEKLPTDTVTAADLEAIEVLNLGNTTAKNLTGIKHLTKLVELDLETKSLVLTLEEVVALAPKSVERLSVTGSGISGSVDSLIELPNLKGFNAHGAEGITGKLAQLATAMPNATILNLGRSGIIGEIEDLAGLKLSRLLVEGSMGITGELNALSTMTDLATLVLGESGVVGDIAALKDLTVMETLVIQGTGAYGDVANLVNMTQLDTLAAAATGLSGNISAFTDLSSLTRVDLSLTEVTGDIAAFANKTDLSTLAIETEDVPGTVTGSIAVFATSPSLGDDAPLPSAQEKEWGVTPITGLKGVNLAGLNLQNQQGVVGTLVDLAKIGANHWPEINLRNTSVSGDIVALKNNTYKVLDLSGTKISGNTSSFAGFEAPRLWQKLLVSNTALEGDIAGFNALSELTSLDITNTKISGNLSTLACEFLAVFYAANTKLVGTTDTLATRDALNFINLSGTSFTGKLDVLQTLDNLQVLDLSKTSVSGDPTELLKLQYIHALILNDMNIALDPLTFFAYAQAVDIPVAYEGAALDPKNIIGSGQKQNNQMLWQVPGISTGTLSYDFETTFDVGEDGTPCTYSGTVSQNYVKWLQSYTYIDEKGNSLTRFPTLTGTASPYEVRINADFKKFYNEEEGLLGSVIFNGSTLIAGAQYTYRPGSTIITLDGSVFNGLANGEYELVVTFSDGYARGTIPVQLAKPTPIPPTGDSPYMAVAVGLILLSLVAFCVAATRTRRSC